MSAREQDQRTASGDTKVFFIPSESEENCEEPVEDDGDGGGGGGGTTLVMVQQKRLREILHMFSQAIRYDSVKPEQISTLVGFILQNFKKNESEDGCSLLKNVVEVEGSELLCPQCQRFLWKPVTAPCGHSFCKSCLLQTSVSRCSICTQEVGGHLKTNVLLCTLLEKWFPQEVQKSRRISEAEGLLKSKRFHEAVSLTTQLLETDPSNVRVWLCRAEAYRSLEQNRRALEDWDLCENIAPSLEVFFCKATLLKEMGRVDEALRLFLRCLSADEDFKQARQEVENILREMLCPACENVQASLKQSTHNPSAHLRQKAAVTRPGGEPDSAHPPPETADWSESSERSGLSRAQSLHGHAAGGVSGEGLKRVSSAPQLGEKGVLLKRKLSRLETGAGVVDSNDTKHKKPGVVCGGATAGAPEDQAYHTVPKDLLDPTDFECSLCMRLFYDPVTAPCGHSFCKNCLQRSLDHSPQCPLCKESLKLYLASRKYSITRVLDDIIKRYLAKEHAVRRKVHNDEAKELSDLENSVPVFVCTMAYPTVPCPLHVFEPRYRLMMRRCIETETRQFGMCISDPQKGFADFGCMLHIRSVHFLPDGRSVVDTVGGKRFRILTRGMRDGYCIANIEYLQDQKVEGEEQQELQDLYDEVYEQASVWFHSLENRFRNQILQHFGAMPEKENDIQWNPNGPACCWWLLAVLPVDPRYQLSLLSMITLKQRLVKIQHILTYLQNSTHT
ncbi:LON peptidase N-terminal domain and ring finger 1, like [Trichomycterus rosablanca]|uniref:LON peptidase N-terminal domain and ring finger 1, like n=1 Tax=Trichomycterus rosablanca TaxID=2290929 RepID=UPI002F351D6E